MFREMVTHFDKAPHVVESAGGWGLRERLVRIGLALSFPHLARSCMAGVHLRREGNGTHMLRHF